MSLGLFVSAFARTEFQAVQFMPAVVFPQILLCGLLVPRARMEHVLEVISYALPLTWAFERPRTQARGSNGIVARDAAIVVGVTIAALALAATTLRRRTT